MKIINVIEKTALANDSIILDLCSNTQGDTVVGDIYLDAHNDVEIAVHGSVDGTHWHKIKVVDMANYSVVPTIAGIGYYMIPAAGLAKVEFKFTEAGRVTIKETY